MSEQLRSRYPGIYSFSSEQKDLFFGREAEISQLLTMIAVEKQVLLYGKSGLGKTSLLNAGVSPRLPEECLAIPIRFYSWRDLGENAHEGRAKVVEAGNLRPTQRVMRLVRQELFLEEAAPSGLLGQLDGQVAPLWQVFKWAQQQHPSKRFILLFDQFEELFTYPTEQVKAFKEQLSELLQETLPPRIMQQVAMLRREDRSRVSREALKQLQQAPDITVVYAIRTDKMALLDRIKDQLKGIGDKYLELLPLNQQDARQAIEGPAQAEGSYQSARFSFGEGAVDRILNFLGQGGKKPLETTQLQIICARIEEVGRATVRVEDLPDFTNVFREFYEEAISRLSQAEQPQASALVEDELIRNGQRISLDQQICLESISQASLDLLVNARLLRREPNSVGGLSYELSHDTLIDPILLVAEERRQQQAQEEERRKREEARQEEQRQQQAALRAAEAEAEQQRQERLNERKQQRRIVWIVGVAFLISTGFAIFGFVQLQRAEAEKEKAETQLRVAQEARLATEQEKLKNARRELDMRRTALEELRAQFEDGPGMASFMEKERLALRRTDSMQQLVDTLTQNLEP